MDTFTRAYLEAALWSSIDDNEKPLDANYTFDDIHSDTLALMQENCRKFQEENAEYIGDRASQAGHDFWLTRNYHGCGFWEKDDWPENSDKLTEAAHFYKECDLYIGDDGMIHL